MLVYAGIFLLRMHLVNFLSSSFVEKFSLHPSVHIGNSAYFPWTTSELLCGKAEICGQSPNLCKELRKA